MNSKNALVVIDIQNYFIDECTRPLLNKITTLIESRNFDFVLFSKFVNNSDSNFYKLLKWKECETSPGINIHPAMSKFVNKNNVFDKSTFSIFKSKIVDFFAEHNISKIYLCGVDIDACVLASAYDGFDLGYDIEILKDCSLSSSGLELEEPTIKIIEKNLEQLKVL